MDATDTDFEARLADLWAAIDDCGREEFVARMQALTSELGDDSAIADFERASAFDSTGYPEQAVPLYRSALARGLTGIRRRRATIQLASSLRNLGDVDASVSLLRAEREAGSDELDDAVSAFLALALTSAGREREAVSYALGALAPHLPRYQRSLANYARDLRDGPEAGA